MEGPEGVNMGTMRAAILEGMEYVSTEGMG